MITFFFEIGFFHFLSSHFGKTSKRLRQPFPRAKELWPTLVHMVSLRGRLVLLNWFNWAGHNSFLLLAALGGGSFVWEFVASQYQF